MAKQKTDHVVLWKGIAEQDFYNESNIIDEELGDFDLAGMTLFSQNVNIMRHLPRLADSLKPVERRILYTMNAAGSLPDKKAHKSSKAVSDTMGYHAHGDGSIYKTIVGMAQPWKTPIPLIQGIGNFGNDALSNGYAHMRYTEARMSKYAYDCFFKDFDEDCIETIFNTSIDGMEPIALPSRYPNILINGGFGIAIGNSYCVPTYDVEDVVNLCKRLIDNPNHPNIYINPTSPTGCDVVDNGTLREICDTGTGVWRMRSTIEIDGHRPNVWILKVKNIPWMTSITSIEEKLVKLAKDGVLPIKDLQDNSYPITEKVDGVPRNRKVLDYWILINKAHDPNIIKKKLYTMTELEKSLSVNFKVVEDALSVGKLNMRDLVLAWLDTRKEYKRRLMNKKIVKINARISLLDILITLTEYDNIEKTIGIIKNNNTDEIIGALMKHARMNSFQAKQIAEMRLRAFSKDSRDNYINERIKIKNDLANIMDMVKSPKKINDVIKEELNGLLRYNTSQRSNIITLDTNIKITDTDHFLVVTKQGMMKKLPYDNNIIKKTPALGSFKTNDYPVHGFSVNNHDSVMLFDGFGKYSVLPVHCIENTEPSQYGTLVFASAKLEGSIVSAFEYFSNDTKEFVKDKIASNVYMLTLTKNGYLKKTPIDEYQSTRSIKSAVAMKVRDDDSLVFAMPVLDHVNLLIYTEQGHYSYISTDDISLQSKNSMGLLSITLDIDDACAGICIIGPKDEYIVVATDKGNVKKCELSYLGGPGKRKLSSYLATLDVNDKVIYVNGVRNKDTLTVCTRTAYQDVRVIDIPIKARKSKGQKMIAVPLGNNIISINIR